MCDSIYEFLNALTHIFEGVFPAALYVNVPPRTDPENPINPSKGKANAPSAKADIGKGARTAAASTSSDKRQAQSAM
jgi:hypothetical protein